MNGKAKSLSIGEIILKLTIWDSGEAELTITALKSCGSFIFSNRQHICQVRDFLAEITKEKEVEAK